MSALKKIVLVACLGLTLTACRDNNPRPTGPTDIPPFNNIELFEGNGTDGTPIVNGDTPAAGSPRNLSTSGSTTVDITVSNPNSDSNLNLSSLQIVNTDGSPTTSFTVSDISTLDTVLSPGETTTFTITYTGSSSTTETARAELIHDNPDTFSPFIVNVTGVDSGT